MLRAPIERFTEKYVKKLVVVDGKLLCCWLWTASLDADGYGRFFLDGKRVKAHRWSYRHYVGPIPKGKVLDHYRCWTPNCVNPAHLRPTSDLENIQNGRTHNAVKQHCKHGHAFTPENTLLTRQAKGNKVYVGRRCRKCQRQAEATWKRRHPS